MDAIRLNLSDAFRLASVLSKYVDTNNLTPQTDAIDFISDIVNKLSPDEYLHCAMLLSQTDEQKIKQEIGLDILIVFVEGLKLNQIVNLIRFFKSLGL